MYIADENHMSIGLNLIGLTILHKTPKYQMQ